VWTCRRFRPFVKGPRLRGTCRSGVEWSPKKKKALKRAEIEGVRCHNLVLREEGQGCLSIGAEERNETWCKRCARKERPWSPGGNAVTKGVIVKERCARGNQSTLQSKKVHVGEKTREFWCGRRGEWGRRQHREDDLKSRFLGALLQREVLRGEGPGRKIPEAS